MDCKVVSLNGKDQFIPKIKNSDPVTTGLLQYDAAQQISLKKGMFKEDNGRETALVNVIREYMNDLKLSSG